MPPPLQAKAWLAPALEHLGDASKANHIAALPPYPIFALTPCLLTLRQGAHLALIPDPRAIPKFVAVLKKRPFHMLRAVNAQFRTLGFASPVPGAGGGVAASEGMAREWQKMCGNTLIERGGMSETCTVGTHNPVGSAAFSGTIGLPLPGIDTASQGGERHGVPLRGAGEICIRGPSVAPRYCQHRVARRSAPVQCRKSAAAPVAQHGCTKSCGSHLCHCA